MTLYQTRILVVILTVAIALAGCSNVSENLEVPLVKDAQASLKKDAEMYASEQGVTVEEALRRLTLQDAIGDLDAELALNEQATFAGLWIQHAPQYRVIVQFTQDGEETIKPYIENGPLAELVELRTAKLTLVELEASQDAAMDEIHDLGIRADSGIDVYENRVEVYVTDQTPLDVALQTTNTSLHNAIVVLTVDELSNPEADIYAGRPLSTCTTGYSVQNSSGTKGITTAAHCGNSQSYNGTALTFRAELYTGEYDVQWHTGSGLTYRPWAYDGLYDTQTPQFRIITGTRSRTNQALDEYVCKYGKTTGYTCGYIKDKNYRSSSPSNATATYIRVSNPGVNLSEGGDSGGPWYRGSIAYGIHHTGIGDDATYMAINYISGLGLTVLTGQ